MKKFYFILITLTILSLYLYGCNSVPDSETDTDEGLTSDISTVEETTSEAETSAETENAETTEAETEDAIVPIEVSYGNNSYTVWEPNVSNQGEVIYYHDFSNDLGGFYGTGAEVELKEIDGVPVMYVYDRNAWWDGAKIKFEEPILVPGETYLFSVEFFQDTEEEMKLAYNVGQKINGETDEDGIKGYKVKKETWTTLQGIYTAKEGNTRDHIFIYEGSGKLNFYVKSVKIERIEYDASDASSYDSICELAADHGFLFGSLLTQNTLEDPERQEFFNRHYNIASCGNYLFISKTKTKEADDGMPHSNFEECDEYYEYAKAHGMKIRGHAIVPSGDSIDWFFRENYDPEGEYVDKETVLKRLDAYIGEILTHYETKYPGMTVSWDVVNEMYEWLEDDIFYDYFGDEMWDVVYGIADKYTDTPLFYNDYCMFVGRKCDKICEIADRLNKNGMVLDGVGMESYYSARDTVAITDREARNSLYRTAMQYHEHGLDVHLSEATLRIKNNTAEGQAQLEQAYRDLYNLVIDINREETVISVITHWGWKDNAFLLDGEYSYGLAGTFSGLVTYNLKAKPTLQILIDVLKQP